MALFPDGAPAVDREERWAQVEAFSEEQRGVWEELDDAFYEYRDNLTGMLRRFVKGNQGGFSSVS